jgi:signal transduction histidine kinase
MDEREQAEHTQIMVLRGMLHDMQNTVSASIGRLNLVEYQGPLTQPQRESLDRAREALRMTSDRLVRALDYAHRPAGRVPIVLGDLLQRVAAELADTASAAGITCTVTAPPGLVLVGDPVQIEQIVHNLITNAIRYNRPHGHVWVTAAVVSGGIELVVRDDGTGIHPDDIGGIFGYGVRARSSSASSTGILGRGLGLWLVDTWVRAHGGSIRVSSTVDVGTTFTVFLPLHGAEPADADDTRVLDAEATHARQFDQEAGERGEDGHDEDDEAGHHHTPWAESIESASPTRDDISDAVDDAVQEGQHLHDSDSTEREPTTPRS